jgi:hypothetical protein
VLIARADARGSSPISRSWSFHAFVYDLKPLPTTRIMLPVFISWYESLLQQTSAEISEAGKSSVRRLDVAARRRTLRVR